MSESYAGIMKKTLLAKCFQFNRSLLPAMTALAVTAVVSTGCATSGITTDSPRHDRSASHHDSDPVGPDYYSSNDNPFHSD
jgi:hypothetical protein